MAVNPLSTTFCPSFAQPRPSARDGEEISVSARGLRKAFGKLEAVRDVSLRVAAGEALGLLGPNGAGKSTTLLLLAGVLRPDAGSVHIAGQRDPGRPQVRRQLGFVPQTIALYADLTARENLQLFGRLYGVLRDELGDRVEAALAMAKLSDRANDRVGSFSGGMQRRLNLAVATVHQPKVLLLDEPSVGVDPHSRAHIFSCIERLKAQGMSIVYSTHYLEEAERLCDQVAIIDRGIVLASGTRDALVRRFGGSSLVEASMPRAPKHASLARHWSEGRLSLATTDPTSTLYQLLKEHHDVTELCMRRPDLESVFLRLTGRSLRDG